LECYKATVDEKNEKVLKGKKVFTYGVGGVFGELALMYNAPRAASIYSVGKSVLLSVDRDTFNHIVKNATIEKRKRFDGFLDKIEILSTLDSYEREKICDCLTSETFKKGEEIIK
jgi:cAMP-dependent protein kinase regulator